MLKYAKSLAMVAATAASALVAVLADGVTPGEWLMVVNSAVFAAAVFTAPNVPGARYTKSVLAFLGAGLAVAISVITDGITLAEGIQIALAGLAAIGVRVAPNAGDMLARTARPQPTLRL
ncbi:hypothetical protein GCM10010124_41140 [Pilimelia terevasa]|uniref:Holin n=1 Tax=Pilimelia terevasa TaxID=53372 RepID=A0A8J3BSD2_9ACTN|nr:hypothetical protein [Pilimelia terevasa]GGK44089.1 hypothetical protein GCM10010124_41140 [Pilimelia terevasa]